MDFRNGERDELVGRLAFRLVLEDNVWIDHIMSTSLIDSFQTLMHLSVLVPWYHMCNRPFLFAKRLLSADPVFLPGLSAHQYIPDDADNADMKTVQGYIFLCPATEPSI